MNFLKKHFHDFIFGAIAGFANGILGAGGGIIAAYYLSRALDQEEKRENGVFANAVATMLPISVRALILYIVKGYIKLDSSVLSLLPPGAIGGILGAFLLTKIKFGAVKIIFSILVIISGILMIFK